MALGLGTPDSTTIKQYVRKGGFTLYAKECDSTGTPLTTGDGTIWQAVGFTKGTSFSRQNNPYKETDDTGNAVVNNSALDSHEISFTLLERRAASRLLFENADGKYYQIVAQGADISAALTEFHAFAICNFVADTSYDIGEKGQTSGGKIVTTSNTSSITVTPPTTLTASTLTIPVGRMWYTADLAHA